VLTSHLELGAVVWQLDSAGQCLRAVGASLGRSDAAAEAFLKATLPAVLRRGEDLPGRVWNDTRPHWTLEIEQSPSDRRDPALAAGLRSAAAFPVNDGNQLFGVIELLSHALLEPGDRLTNMMAAVGGEIMQFLHRRNAEADLRRANDELELRVQQRTAELKTANTRLNKAISDRKRLEQEILDLTEKERRRIGLDLHDDLGQKLAGIAMMTKALELRLAKLKGDETADAARIHELVQEAIHHTRGLARDLATLDLKETDLDSAMRGLAQRVHESFGLECGVTTRGTVPALEPEAIRHLYKIAQECVTNAIKHAKAKKVAIRLDALPDRLLLIVQNDGYPFPDMKSQSTGMGLRIISYRASLIGGEFEIKGAGRKGAIATCTLPLQPAA
jgi:signal transduction histidine kinase